MNILLQMEAKAVKNASSLLQFSGHSEIETGIFQQSIINAEKSTFKVIPDFALRISYCAYQDGRRK